MVNEVSSHYLYQNWSFGLYVVEIIKTYLMDIRGLLISRLPKKGRKEKCNLGPRLINEREESKNQPKRPKLKFVLPKSLSEELLCHYKSKGIPM